MTCRGEPFTIQVQEHSTVRNTHHRASPITDGDRKPTQGLAIQEIARLIEDADLHSLNKIHMHERTRILSYLGIVPQTSSNNQLDFLT